MPSEKVRGEDGTSQQVPTIKVRILRRGVYLCAGGPRWLSIQSEASITCGCFAIGGSSSWYTGSSLKVGMAPPIRSIKGVRPLLIAVCLVFTTFPFHNSFASENHTVDRDNYLNSGPQTTVPFLSTDDGDDKTETPRITTQEQNEKNLDIHDELKRFFELKPKIDNSPNPDEVEEIQRRNPNLPIAFWNDKKNKNMHYKNESCAEFPSIFDLSFNNQHWQTLLTSNGTFRLYGAYYETRELSKIKPIVRILGVLNRIEPTVKTYCQLWFPSLNEPVFGEVLEYHFVWYKFWGRYQQGLYQPYLISCEIPSTFQKDVPAAVSLVEKPCNMASNILRVNYNKLDKKKDFVVCVKGLDFPYSDLSVRLVEWIEVVRTLGADKIVFYEFDIHPNASKVLKYYEKSGFVETVHHTLPAGKPNLPGLQHMYLANRRASKNQLEIIPYNDCFYKNMYAYRYVVLLDIDEVIVPAEVSTWKELMDIVEAKAFAEKKEPRDVFSARNVYFFDNYPEKLGWFEDIPRYMYMLQHAYRTMYFTPPFFYVKSFFNTDRALSLNHHYTFTCLKPCDMYEIPIPDAKLHHFRGDCVPELQRVCNELRNNVVIDKAIWNIKDKVIEGTIDTLKKLGFFTWNVTFSGK